MILISHRGNIKGKNPEMENSPKYIKKALDLRYNVEIDVHEVNGKCFLGHDYPQYQVDWDFLLDKRLWCHAKNLGALRKMMDIGAHCFWHQEDDFTLTSKGYVWTYPGKELKKGSICVLPEFVSSENVEMCSGICSDYIGDYNE
tara:strand:+ start:670 stop:1101 length:432 start_codon:yes stop_codon:yes gene_type:complete